MCLLILLCLHNCCAFVLENAIENPGGELAKQLSILKSLVEIALSLDLNVQRLQEANYMLWCIILDCRTRF